MLPFVQFNADDIISRTRLDDDGLPGYGQQGVAEGFCVEKRQLPRFGLSGRYVIPEP